MKKTTRRQAREWAIQMLTAADLNPSDAETVSADFWAQMRTLDDEDGGNGGEIPRAKMRAFAEERVAGVLGTLDEIDEALSPMLAEGGWDIGRLGTIERAVLRMAVWEMRHTDIPKPVVINEAIDLVNWFSSSKSRTIVNGILDRYAKSF